MDATTTVNESIAAVTNLATTWGFQVVGADLPTARRTIEAALVSHDKVLKNPKPMVGVENFGDTASRMVIRPWCATNDYWDLKYTLPERVKAALAEVGVSMPTPQRDILLTDRRA